MNMKNICLITLLIIAMSLLALPAAQAGRNDGAMTNAELVKTLCNMLKLEMPANADILSDTERFKIQANILAKGGIAQFIDAEPDEVVARSVVVNLFYATMDGPSDATMNEKIDYVAAQGYMFAGGEDDPMQLAEIDRWKLSEAVAEAYTSPEEVGLKEESKFRRFFRNTKRRLKSGVTKIFGIFSRQSDQ